MSNWYNVKVPRPLYLPVVEGEGFDNTGQLVQPSDTVEFCKGSNLVRINGVEKKLLRSTDTIPVVKGVISLTKPKGVTIGGNGVGRAVVSAVGMARNKRGFWNHEAAEEWQGDAGTLAHPSPAAHGSTDLFGKPDKNRGFRVVQDDTPAFGTPVRSKTAHSGAPDREWSSAEQAVIEELHQGIADQYAKTDGDFEYRDVTLRDGTTARALFNKVTGKQVGTPERRYISGGPGGQPLGYSRSFDQDEYDRRVAAQAGHASVAPNAAERWEQAQAKHASRTLHGEGPKPQAVPEPTPEPDTRDSVSLGNPHIDHEVAAKLGTQQPGVPLGMLVHLSGPEDLRDALTDAARATYADSLEAAVGKMFMRPDSSAPIIAVRMDNIDKAKLADDLPSVATAFEQSPKPCVLVISTSGEGVPKLINFVCEMSIQVMPHHSKEEFITCVVRDSTMTIPNPLKVG